MRKDTKRGKHFFLKEKAKKNVFLKGENLVCFRLYTGFFSFSRTFFIKICPETDKLEENI